MDFTNQIDIKNFTVRGLVPLVGCVAAAFATIYIMQEVNPLAAACICAAAVLTLVAVVAPRTGLIILLFLCAYSDLLKRMLLFWSELSWGQLSYVLAAAPLVVVGLVISIITEWAFRSVQITRRDVITATFIAIAMLANFLMAKRTGAEILEGLKVAANSGLYMALIVVGSKFITDERQMLKIFRWMLLVFVPVAIYGIVQSIFGFADFEILYLNSGFTVTAFELSPRPFSTLNSAGALGDVSAAMAIFSLAPFIVRRTRVLPLATKTLAILLFLLFSTACLLSLVRHSLFVLLATFAGLACFGSTRRTFVFYTVILSLVVAIVLSASFLFENLANWDPAAGVTNVFAERALGIQTYSERLKGFINLTHSTAMYSPFGLPESEKMTETTYNHDPLSSLLVDYGVFAVIIVLGGMVLALKAAHGALLAMPQGPQRETAVMLISLIISILVSHFLFHGVLSTFPVNAIFWLSVGLFVSLSVNKEGFSPASVLDESVPPDGSAPRWMVTDSRRLPTGVSGQTRVGRMESPRRS